MSIKSEQEVLEQIGQEARIDRLVHVVRKLSGWQGYDISDLIEDGYLEEGDV